MEHRNLVLQLKKDKQQTTEEIEKYMQRNTLRSISRFTLAKMLHKKWFIYTTTNMVCAINASTPDTSFSEVPGTQELDSSANVVELRMRAALVSLANLDRYNTEKMEKHENIPPLSSKGTCLKVREFSCEKVSCLVAIPHLSCGSTTGADYCIEFLLPHIRTPIGK